MYQQRKDEEGIRKGRKKSGKMGTMTRIARVWKGGKATFSTNIPPMSHGLKYLQANRKATGKTLTKEGMVKKCSYYSDSFGESEGKKEILASVMYLGSHHQGHLHKNYPRNQSGKTFARQIVHPE